MYRVVEYRAAVTTASRMPPAKMDLRDSEQ